MTDEVQPLCIFHDGDRQAFSAATREEQDAWIAYVHKAADDFNNHPYRDSYDSTDVFPGWNRDGKMTPWCPPRFFPEWLARHRTLQAAPDTPTLIASIEAYIKSCEVTGNGKCHAAVLLRLAIKHLRR